MNLRDKLKFWIMLSNYVDMIVRGTSPISLPDAIANSLLYVKAFGGTEQNGTPTPDTPVDIVSNNGVLKVRHKSGLPLGYTLLDYIESSGTQYIDTGVQDTSKVEVRINVTEFNSNYNLVHGSQKTSSPAIRRHTNILAASHTPQINVGTNNNASVVTTSAAMTAGVFYDLTLVYSTTASIIVDGVATTATSTGDNASTGLNDFLFTYNYGGTPNYNVKAKMSYAKIWDSNNSMVRNFVPAKRNSDNVVGMYDTVSGTFFTNAGTGDFTAGNTVSDPVEIYTDGTVETINAHGKNLFNQALFDTDVASTITYTTFEIPNGTYTMSTNFPYAGGATNVFIFAGEATSGAATTTNGVYDGQSRTITVTNGKYTVAYRSTTLASSNTNNPKDYDFQLELGSTATPYAPYYNGGTATTEMLLKVGDYQDVQSIIDGVITRNVGIKVLDGTESWEAIVGTYPYFRTITDIPYYDIDIPTELCTHSKCQLISTNINGQTIHIGRRAPQYNMYVFARQDSVCVASNANIAIWKRWLADQYAAGTPVIVLYPLATPTTESVAGQHLQVTSGDNVLEITQASLDGLELEAEYTKQG